MLTSYKSLDPQNAETMNSQARRALFNQRVLDAQGGETAKVVSGNFKLLGAALTIGIFKKQGFNFFPMTAQKLPRVGAVVLSMYIFGKLGRAYTHASIGDRESWTYLTQNRSAILSGELPMDRAPEGLPQ